MAKQATQCPLWVINGHFQSKQPCRKGDKGAVRYQEVSDDGTPAFAPLVGSL
jgi:hypothetical protein